MIVQNTEHFRKNTSWFKSNDVNYKLQGTEIDRSYTVPCLFSLKALCALCGLFFSLTCTLCSFDSLKKIKVRTTRRMWTLLTSNLVMKIRNEKNVSIQHFYLKEKILAAYFRISFRCEITKRADFINVTKYRRASETRKQNMHWNEFRGSRDMREGCI